MGPPSPPEIGRAGLHGTTKTGTTQGAASSGPDQAHEQARSRGPIRHRTGDGTLRLIEKASSCRQMMGHREVNNRGRPGDSCHQRRNRDEGTREAKFLTKGELAGSQDERCHGH